MNRTLTQANRPRASRWRLATPRSTPCRRHRGALSVTAQTAPAPAPAAPAVAITVTPAIVSQYMFRGQRLGGASFQPAIEASYGSFVGGLWSNFPVKDKVPGTSDPEFDFYGSYTAAISDTLSVVPGFTAFYYPDADTKAGFYKFTFEPSLAVNYTTSGIKFTPKIFYDFVLDGPTFELGAGYALPLKDLGTELGFSASIGTYLLNDFAKNSTPRTKAWGDYWSVGAAAPFQLTKESKLTVGFAYTKGAGAYTKVGSTPKSENTLAVGRGVVTVSYSYAF